MDSVHFSIKCVLGFGRLMLVPQLVVKWVALLNGTGCLVESCWSLKILPNFIPILHFSWTKGHHLVEKFDHGQPFSRVWGYANRLFTTKWFHSPMLKFTGWYKYHIVSHSVCMCTWCCGVVWSGLSVCLSVRPSICLSCMHSCMYVFVFYVTWCHFMWYDVYNLI